jgi:hypothetical protein
MLFLYYLDDVLMLCNIANLLSNNLCSCILIMSKCNYSQEDWNIHCFIVFF